MASYVVKSGDSLSIIARDVLGNLARWPELARLNAIEAPYTIYPGQVLTLPADVTPRQAQLVPSQTSAGSPAVTIRAWWRNPWVWFLAAGILGLAALPAARQPRHRRRK